MTTTSRTVLVFGATGNQGGAVAQALLQQGMTTVRAFVRNVESPKALALQQQGAQLVQGSFDDGASIEAAAAGVDAVFVNTSPFAVGIDGEIAHGRTIIDALKRTTVSHVVYSSVSDADRNTGIPHFDSKADAEAYLQASGLPYTITAPVYFSDNVMWSASDIKAGRFRQAMPGNRKLQVVSLREIGQFNAAVIQRGPEQLKGRRINYAGDELTPNDMTAALAQASGRPVAFEEQPLDEMRAFSEDMALMFAWFDSVGYSANIPKLREEFPEVAWRTFADWTQAQDWQQALS